MKRIKLIDFRRGKNDSCEDAAKKINISVAMYKSIEYGYKNPSFETLEKIKKAYPDINVEDIFFNI